MADVKIKKVLQRGKFSSGPIGVMVGDTVNLSFYDKTGKLVDQISAPVETTMTIDEGVLFEGEFEGRAALGGLFLAQEKK